MVFLREDEPARGVALPVLPGIKRLVARNAGPLTYHGTNVYFIEAPDGLTLLDPGPAGAAHLAELRQAVGDVPVRRILLTHRHTDHAGAAVGLQEASGAMLHQPQPEQEFAGFTALATPGHAPDHFCFRYRLPDGRKILFSGDHVMSWSSTVINPPEGDMADYMASLRLLLGGDEDSYLPGHGPLLPQPQAFTAALLAHRQNREDEILAALAGGHKTPVVLTAMIYPTLAAELRPAAERNVLAHLRKLQREGKAAADAAGGFSRA